ncbi:MAG: hypothetical protein LBV68_04725, partial [Spirochaetaceae bacterium]|nr:hypothetical protein [Spirochaetaceae bacterium]
MRHIWLLVFSFSVFFACSYKEASAISFSGSEGETQILYARSQKAQEGKIPLGENNTFEYELDLPFEVPEESSLVIDYRLSGLEPLADNKAECIVSFGNGESYILPINFSFIGIEGIPPRISYAMPLQARLIQKISIQNKADNKKSGLLNLERVSIVPKTLGWYKTDELLYLTPFVYSHRYKDKQALYINPPPEYMNKGKINLRIEGLAADSSFITANKSYKYIADNPVLENNIVIPENIFNSAPYPLIVEGRAAVMVVPAAKRTAYEPIPADPGIILVIPQSSWRNPRYELYSWDIFPSILIFDTADYKIQDSMLKRLAFFAEKKGYRGKIVPDAEIEEQHGWNAHDYPAETLARFFNAANKLDFPLNNDERDLEKILATNGIILKDDKTGAYIPGTGAIISVSREISPIELRQRLMVHECFHGIFFLDKDFRTFSEQALARFDPAARRFLQSYLEYSAYDTQDRFLFVNEFMAYL